MLGIRAILTSRVTRLSLLSGFVLFLIFVAGSNWHILSANQSQLFGDIDNVPARDVGIVFGASPKMRDGRENLHFRYRIDAAVALFRAGKIRHILVSGDNHITSYDEPSEMKMALIRRGIPVTAITCDYAGFRTLDTIVRARKIFGVDHAILITQRYHNTRALEIARANHLDAIGFCTQDVPVRHAIQTEIREVLARSLTILDLYVWNRAPKFLGPYEPIQIANNNR